jgi:hypothetical protein
MDFKLLSRKFILSMILAVISTLLLLSNTISSSNWGFVMTATVISYVVSRTVDKKYGKISFPSFIDRLKAIMSREFIISLLSIIGTSLLCHSGYIDSEVWFKIVLSIGASYNIFNSVEKIDV